MISFLSGILFIKGQSIFNAATPQAEKIRNLTYGFIAASMLILLLVIFLTIYICVKFRAKNGDKAPDQHSGETRIEYFTVGIPFLLVLLFFFWSIRTMSAVFPEQGNGKPDVIITGHQWWWEAVYPGTKVITANEIHLPIGKKLLLQLEAGDVIHDWWVPALGGKMDMIPGMNNHLWVTIYKAGVYEGACSEFCGQQHAWMRIKVIAQSPADYDTWLKTHGTNGASPQDTLAKQGEALFLKSSCSSCHYVSGTTAKGIQGPDLTHFASRQTMLAGLLTITPGNVDRWLTDPQKVKPGAHMPRFIYPPDSIKALTAYLIQLK